MILKMTSAAVVGFLALVTTPVMAQQATMFEPIKKSMSDLLNSGEYSMGTQAMDGRGMHSFVLHGNHGAVGPKAIYCIVSIPGASATSRCYKLN